MKTGELLQIGIGIVDLCVDVQLSFPAPAVVVIGVVVWSANVCPNVHRCEAPVKVTVPS